VIYMPGGASTRQRTFRFPIGAYRP
jgi:hypothetical protein